ncbi:MAG: Fur family transcriptional regulator [Acutalibacteraceae bacterium]
MGYNTKQGDLISALLRESRGEHLTAEDIARALEVRGCAVGRSTVYRHLEKLTREGSVRKFVLHDGESACYQFVGDGHHCRDHYHLKCSECGKLLHVECSYLDKLAAHVLEHHGFTLSAENTVLYGICAECAERKNNEEEK